MEYKSSFEVCGDVVERRELTSEKNKTWRGHLVKIAVVGSTLEVSVTEDQYKAVGVGEAIRVVGRIDRRGDGVVQLVAGTIAAQGRKAGAA